MKRIFLYTVVVVSIPFFVVVFWKREPEVILKEIDLKYLSNVMVRVKRVSSGVIQDIPLEEYVVGVVAGFNTDAEWFFLGRHPADVADVANHDSSFDLPR